MTKPLQKFDPESRPRNEPCRKTLSCTDPGPVQFDGGFSIQRLTVGSSQSYQIYAEPLDGPVKLGDVIENLTSLCPNPGTDPGWPAQYACTAPAAAAPFSARLRPGP